MVCIEKVKKRYKEGKRLRLAVYVYVQFCKMNSWYLQHVFYSTNFVSLINIYTFNIVTNYRTNAAKSCRKDNVKENNMFRYPLGKRNRKKYTLITSFSFCFRLLFYLIRSNHYDSAALTMNYLPK